MRWVWPAVAGVVALVGVSACSGATSDSTSSGTTSATPAALPSSAATTSTGTTSTQGEGGGGSTVTPSPGRSGSSDLSADDRNAGLLDRKVRQSAGGNLKVVKGTSEAPGRGRVYRVAVEVESGLDLDRQKFAAFVLDTLNDKRSWTENGRRTFARTDSRSKADFRVVLASPDTSAAICRPLITYGKLSCRSGDRAVLTMFRWVKGIPDYNGDLDGYRHYVVNHEVGHALGHGHEYCAGRGKRAPLMMQQTKGLKGCKPNPWPFPNR